MATFKELRDRVADYLIDVPSKTNALLGAWVNKAVYDAERKRNFYYMLERLEVVTSTGVIELAQVPNGWKELADIPYVFRVDEDDPTELNFISSETELHRKYSIDPLDRGEAKVVYMELNGSDPDVFKVYPPPKEDGETIVVPYWGYSAALVNDGDTNWLTENAEWYVTFAATAEGLLFNRDREEAQISIQRARTELDDAIRTDKQRARLQPRVLVTRTGVYGATRRFHK